jgi:glycine dehydrogenase subunit 1
MGAMHMSLLGPEGLQHLAVRNMAASTKLKRQLSNLESLHLPYSDQSHFNEFVVELPSTTSACLAYLEEDGIIGGFDISQWYPEKTNQMLLSVTDQTSQRDIDRLIQSLSKWTKEVNA